MKTPATFLILLFLVGCAGAPPKSFSAKKLNSASYTTFYLGQNGQVVTK